MKTGYIWIFPIRNIDSFKTRIYITKMTSISKSSQCKHETFRFGVGFKAGAVESRRLVPVQHNKSLEFLNTFVFFRNISTGGQDLQFCSKLSICVIYVIAFLYPREILVIIN